MIGQVGKQRTIYIKKKKNSEKYKKSFLQSYDEGYFGNFSCDWKSIYLLLRMVTVDTKLRVYQYKIQNILFVNKMFFKIREVKSPLYSFCKVEDKTYKHLLYRRKKFPFCRDNFRSFLVPVLIFLNLLR